MSFEVLRNNLKYGIYHSFSGLRTIDQPLCDAETTTIKSLVCEYMGRPETIIFAVESASCQDYFTSHIVPLMKYAVALFIGLPNIF